MSTFKADAALKAVFAARGSNVDVEFEQMIKKKKSVTHQKSCPSVSPD